MRTGRPRRDSAHRDVPRRDSAHRHGPHRDIATKEIMHGCIAVPLLRRAKAGGRLLSTIVFRPGPRVPEHGEGGKDAADVVIGGGTLAAGMPHVGVPDPDEGTKSPADLLLAGVRRDVQREVVAPGVGML